MNFCRTYIKGEAGYYAERARGSIIVFEDNRKYVYRMASFNGALDFKRFIVSNFTCISAYALKIKGTFPTYTIESSC